MSWEGDILRKLRHERRLTQAQFAEWLEIPKRTYEKWESGERVPPQWVITLIKYKIGIKCADCYYAGIKKCLYYDKNFEEIETVNCKEYLSQ